MRGGVVVTRESDRVTMLEIFFDLVFVFALTRVVEFMANSPTPRTLVRGLLVLVLLWWAWVAFIWLGNQIRLDRGYVGVGMLLAMGGLFIAALVVPAAWDSSASENPAMVLALAFLVVRCSYLALSFFTSRHDHRWRKQILLDALPQTISSILLIVGATAGGDPQTVLWTCAFAVDFGIGWVASHFRGWRLGSPAHFAERHGLVLIIALGETLLSTGAGIGSAPSNWTGYVVSALGLVIAVSLWWSYFGGLSTAAERAISRANEARRPALARDGYSLLQFLLIAGVVYVALGLTLLVSRVVADPTRRAGFAILVLAGGVALYLAGLQLFIRVMIGVWRRAPIFGAGFVLVLAPAAATVQTWCALSCITLVVVVTSAAITRGIAGLRDGAEAVRTRLCPE